MGGNRAVTRKLSSSSIVVLRLSRTGVSIAREKLHDSSMHCVSYRDPGSVADHSTLGGSPVRIASASNSSVHTPTSQSGKLWSLMTAPLPSIVISTSNCMLPPQLSETTLEVEYTMEFANTAPPESAQFPCSSADSIETKLPQIAPPSPRASLSVSEPPTTDTCSYE